MLEPEISCQELFTDIALSAGDDQSHQTIQPQLRQQLTGYSIASSPTLE